jgi:acylpyruvate hydrolase
MKIFCIGRNYSNHAKEMNAPVPKAPVFFMKPDNAITKMRNFYYPKFTSNLHYECELVIKINRVGKNIAEKFAHKYYDEFSLGIDFTARDLQQECKDAGLPWEVAKAWETSAPMSKKWISTSDIDPNTCSFELSKNGQQVQAGKATDMLFSVDKLIAYLSQYHTLKIGDLIFTGTPEGVGPVVIGDELVGKIEGREMFTFLVK